MALNLYKHNSDVYRSVVSMLKEKNKAAVIHPTGTGKSFIAFKLCEDHPESRILWLSPSEYIVRTQIENLKAALPSSPDDNIGSKYDSSEADRILRNVSFCTYARLAYMPDEEMEKYSPDFIILDEFHRCGAKVWGEGVNRLLDMFSYAKILGLSATAIRYLDNRRDMSDELFDGNVASFMSLGEAVVRGILPAPKYVMSVYSYMVSLGVYEDRVSKIRNRAKHDKAVEYLDALKRTLDRAMGLEKIFEKHMTDRSGRYIVFCSDYQTMTEAMGNAKEWFGSVDKNPRIYSFYSEDPASKASFSAFKADNTPGHLKLLYCIDALNEGIHVDGISGVILMRPTVSPIVYKQQIGRALSATGNRVPVIFDIVNNIENLYSIDSLRDEMQETINYLRFTGETKSIVNEEFFVTDEIKDCIELFDRLEGVLTVSWETMYKEAASYYNKYGNLRIPFEYVTEHSWKLGRWVGVQRLNYRKNDGSISEERIKKLSLIGMDWHTPEEKSWSKAYEALKEYKDKNGDLDIHSDYRTDDGLALGRWLRNIRAKYADGTLKECYRDALEDLGMKWESVFDTRWQACFDKAVEYYSAHSNLIVPKSYETDNGIKLGTWICSQRAAYQNGRLKDEQIRLLESIGMSWDRYESKWVKSYECARMYVLNYGDINTVPESFEADGVKLRAWINTQRSRYSEGRLSRERKSSLEELGLKWSLNENRWDNGYRHALKFTEEHGGLTVPTGYECVDGFKLKSWLNNQRTSYKKGKLSLHQTSLLRALGMSLK